MITPDSDEYRVLKALIQAGGTRRDVPFSAILNRTRLPTKVVTEVLFVLEEDGFISVDDSGATVRVF